MPAPARRSKAPSRRRESSARNPPTAGATRRCCHHSCKPNPNQTAHGRPHNPRSLFSGNVSDRRNSRTAPRWWKPAPWSRWLDGRCRSATPRRSPRSRDENSRRRHPQNTIVAPWFRYNWPARPPPRRQPYCHAAGRHTASLNAGGCERCCSGNCRATQIAGQARRWCSSPGWRRLRSRSKHFRCLRW